MSGAPRMGIQPMPFGTFLFGSWAMIAKEAHASASVKDSIVATSMAKDAQREGTYGKETSGTVSARSEFDESIHKVATFTIEFSIAEDLDDVTYEESILCLVRLMYVAHEMRRVDISLCNLTGDWLRCVEESFAGAAKTWLLQSYHQFDKPHAFVEGSLKVHPLTTEQPLASEDRAYFLAASRCPGQEPVPFIQLLNSTFEIWFKKKAEEIKIEGVSYQESQRVCILQCLVTAKYPLKADIPIKETLYSVTDVLVEKFLETTYDGEETKVLVVTDVKVEKKGDEDVHVVGASASESGAWLKKLAGTGWHRAQLMARFHHDPGLRSGCRIRRLSRLPPLRSSRSAARSFGAHPADFKAVDTGAHEIGITFFEERHDSSIPLSLGLAYKPEQSFASAFEASTGRNDRIKDFYWRLWLGGNKKLPALNVRNPLTGPEVHRLG
ncbi:unnamed protein product [Peniophora sp. CBMAI 1063]|nr:unnamed protein product [Peniophora sp. CBMAI 1063]